jgi:uncharacterized protein with von Willebrand factor type A (vWA) domain
MATKVSAEQVLKDSKGISKVWKANPTLTLGKDDDKVALKDYQASVKALTDFNDEIDEVRNHLTELLNSRDAAAATVSGLNTRALSAIRGIYGPDSTEYDQAGGTRTSERKKPTRTKKAGETK